MTDDTPDELAEKIRHQVDQALTRRLENPACLAPASLIRILYPVIEKHLTAGLLLDEVATALQEEGYKVNKGHLVRHLGAIREERGLPPLKRGKSGKRSKGDDVEWQGKAGVHVKPAAVPAIPPTAPSPAAAPTNAALLTAPRAIADGANTEKSAQPDWKPKVLEVDLERRIVRLNDEEYPIRGWMKSNGAVLFAHPGFAAPSMAAANLKNGTVTMALLDSYMISDEPVD